MYTHLINKLDTIIADKDKFHQREFLRDASEIVKVVAELCELDGHLIQIPGVTSYVGEPLYIATRFSDESQLSGKQYLAIDVVAQRDGKLIPVGMKDYEIENGKASGNKQRHDHFDSDSQVAAIVDGFWTGGNGLEVRGDDLLKFAETQNVNPFIGMSQVRAAGLIGTEVDWGIKVYQERGIASLMTAASIVLLRYLDVKKLVTISLTSNAIKTWKHYGIASPGTFSLDDLVQKPKGINEIRKAFQID